MHLRNSIQDWDFIEKPPFLNGSQQCDVYHLIILIRTGLFAILYYFNKVLCFPQFNKMELL